MSRTAQLSRTGHAGRVRVIGQGLAVALVLLAPGGLHGQSTPRQPPVLGSSLTGEDPVSTDGTFDLSWQIDEASRAAAEKREIAFEIEEFDGGGARAMIDAGSHLSAALSGRDDGSYRYRVRAVRPDGQAGPWSESLEIRVAHHPLWLAFTLFGVGAVVFLATVALILLGQRRSRTPQAE